MDIYMVVDTESILKDKEKQLKIATGIATGSAIVIRFSNNYTVKAVASTIGLMACGFMTARIMDKYFG